MLGTPTAIAFKFFGAIDGGQWKYACELMLPGTRKFIRRGSSCSLTLERASRASFDEFTFSRHHWTSVRILKVGAPIAEANTLAVSLQVEERYTCEEVRGKRPCRRHSFRYVRDERLYLATDAHGRWRIAKTGAILRDIELSAPQYAEVFLAPPATARSIERTAQIPPPPFACSGKVIASITDSAGDVIDGDYNKIADTPWLDATSLSIVRIGPEAICLAIGLVEAPHPDSEYRVFWHRPEGTHGGSWPTPNGQTVADQGSVAGWGESDVAIAVDGEGIAHATINDVGAMTQPSLAPYLPKFGFADGKLEIELSARQGFPLNQIWSIFPVINGEPSWYDSLLRRSLPGEDRVPDNECVTYPSGKLASEFFCQAPSG